MRIGLFLAIAFFLSSSLETLAESYIGIGAGVSFANTVSKTKVDVDTAYAGKVPNFGTLSGYRITDSDLDESFAISGKIGHYFDKFPFLGVEAEIGYSRPDFKEQSLVLSHPNFPTLYSLQRGVDIHDFQAGASVLLRYPGFKRVQPYIGVGPQVHYLRMRGTGEAISGPFPTLPNLNQTQEQDLKGDYISVGLQGKAGVRIIPIRSFENFAVDIEYKANLIPIRMNQFRDLRNFRGNTITHQVGAALVYRFGNI